MLTPKYHVAETVECGGKSYTVKRRMYDYEAKDIFYICYRKGDRTMIRESDITSGSHQAS
jgi:hypothetical protein